MEKNSFSLKASPNTRRAQTAIPTQLPWDPPPRRTFSSCEPLHDRTNTEALEDFVDRFDEPPAYLRDDAKAHRPFTNPRFGSLRLPSADGPRIEIDEHAAVGQSQGDSGRKDSIDLTCESPSHRNSGSGAQVSSQSDPSFTNMQDMIDSVWEMPEQIQEGFDGMKEVIQNRKSALHAERRTSARLEQDVESMQRKLKALQGKQKELEGESSKLEDALHVSSAQCEERRKENEKLRSEIHNEIERFEKAQEEAKKIQRNISGDLEDAKRELQLKEEDYDRIHEELVNRNRMYKDEVKRSEGLVEECQAFEQHLSVMRERANEEKQEWSSAREKDEAKIKALQISNSSLAAETKILQEAVRDQKALIEVKDNDLYGLLSFLKVICNAHRQVYEAASLHGHPALSKVIALPRSKSFTIEEWDYSIFGELSERMSTSSSSLSANVLEFSDSYEKALQSFFETIIMRDVAQSQFICSVDEALQGLHSTHVRIRGFIEAEQQRVKALSANLSSNLIIVREQASETIQVFNRKARSREQELEKAMKTIESLSLAATASTTKNKEAECSLWDEIRRLEATLHRQDAELKESSNREVDLKKTNDELLHNSQQAIAKSEENKKRNADLNHEKEKIVGEKNTALKRLAETEAGVQQMSAKVSEALAAKQAALKDLIHERSVNEELIAKLQKLSDTSRKTSGEVAYPRPKAAPSVPASNQKRDFGVGDMSSETRSGSRGVQIAKPRVSPVSKKASSSSQPLVNLDSDPDFEIAPKRARRCAATHQPKKKKRQKLARSCKENERINAFSSMQKLAAKEFVPSQKSRPKTSSSSDITRDEDWDVDVTMGDKQD